MQKHKKKGRPPSLEKALFKLKKLGVFRTGDATRFGISQPSLSRFVAEGKIRCVESQLYLHPDSRLTGQKLQFAVACAKFGPKSVIGGLTALFYYGLIEQVPGQVWILVPYERKNSDSLYRCLRTKTNPKEGVHHHQNFQITNLERTLVEAFRYSSKIGLRIAFRAIREAVRQRKSSLQKIYQQAKKLKMEKFIAKYWEALVPESEALR